MALRCAFHLAVLTGPETGWCLGLAGRAVVGRGPGDLVLTDPLVSRRHLELRLRAGRVQARDAGSANGTWWHRPRPRGGVGRRRRLRRGWRELVVGTRLVVGATVLEVRRRPTSLHLPAPPPTGAVAGAGAAAGTGPGDRPAGGRRRWGRRTQPTAAPGPGAPDQPGPRRPRAWDRTDVLRVGIPLLLCLTTAGLLLGSGAGPARWALLALPVGMLALALGAARPRPPTAGSDPRPDAAALLLLAAAAPPPLAPGAVLHLTLPGADGGGGGGGGDGGGADGGAGAGATLDVRPGDAVALLGPADAAARAARLLLAEVGVLHGGRVGLAVPPDWPAPPPPDPDPAWWLTVVDAAEPQPAPPAPPAPAPPAAASPASAPPAPATSTLVLAERLAAVPPWCTRVVPVSGGVGAPWAAAVAALLAARRREPGAALPTEVRLTAAVGPLTADAVASAWRAAGATLPGPVGADAEGLVELDLVTDGPHALVAGTTGSGKSELLLAYLLGLALRHSPADLQLVLLDYKGGATFGPLADLPHAAGVLTDLDPAGTARALASLRAEVRRRERLLAAAGAKDLAEHRARGGTGLPRLLVVVDEFRTLAQTHPDVLDALVRLAAQGRSLGVHLVLATQRPGGAVGPDVRANLTARLCLRVLDPADSLDVLGTAAAAALPVHPGRAVLRTDRTRTLQALWCGPPDEAVVARACAAVTAAWQRQGAGAPPRPWAPALPTRVTLAELAAEADGPGLAAGPGPAAGSGPADGGGPGRAMGPLLARTDLPEEQRLGVWAWDSSALLVTGGPGTGRTELVRAAATGALAAGVEVAMTRNVGARPEAFADLGGPALGTVVGTDDPRRAARLLEPARPRRAGPAGARRRRRGRRVRGPRPRAPGGRGGAARRGGAGRGAHPGGGGAHRAAVAGRRPLDGGGPHPAGAGAAGRGRGPARRRPAPPDGRPAGAGPRGAARARPGHRGAGRPRRPAVGGAGDRAGDRARELGPGPGWGRSGARVPGPPARAAAAGGGPGPPRRGRVGPGAARRRRGRRRPGGRPARRRGPAAGGGPPGQRPQHRARRRAGPGPGAAAVDLRPGPTPAGPTPAAPAAAGPGTVALVDDADAWPPEALAALVQGTLADRAALVLAARTETVLAAFRGPLAEARATGPVLVLAPARGGAARLTDLDLTTAIDPVRPYHSGLGVLVRGGSAQPVQVALP
ncbi:FHA domain-containing protein [Georgenia sp. TF02-10]|uniref:FtsK/SpoIIIE domain-containing protein n=1 Tax=Georgenia sp. TF02-10 TaxID=2917725 RepID=UPI001FA7A984|nr:FtsK/SpoIIIE domain-containing protein [Georgenia sp. TF02-10]UNX53923.1 FHA domain-containing protein [Georgenia sp. TF02-10]